VEPTLIADEMQPGALRAPVYPLLPAAITTAMPNERNWSMAAFRAAFSESHTVCFSYRPPPRLIFTAAIR
jgi:hypothetical protein